MRSPLILLILSLIFISLTIINARDILNEEDSRDIQRYCEKYATCRKSARQQFERCAGGFSKMIMAQTDSLRIKPSTRSDKCEKQLIQSIETEIQPVYQLIEHDTFECTKTTDPQAFNLDQSQTLVCRAIQQEVGLDNFAISGAENGGECRNTYESQMERCNLVKDCCPQFNHCHTKAELENNVFGKEEKLAQQLDACIGYKKIDGKPATYKHYLPADARRAPPSPSTKSTTTEAPLTTPPPPATFGTLPTLPPADKVLNDLARLLFPNLVTTAKAAPPSTTPSATTTTPKAPTTTKSIFERVEEIRNTEANKKKVGTYSLSQISQWRTAAKKMEQLNAKSKEVLTAPTPPAPAAASASLSQIARWKAAAQRMEQLQAQGKLKYSEVTPEITAPPTPHTKPPTTPAATTTPATTPVPATTTAPRFESAKLSQIARWKAAAQKMDQLKAQGRIKDEDEAFEAAPSKPAKAPQKKTSRPFPTPEVTTLPEGLRPRIHAAPLIAKAPKAMDKSQKESLSELYCENYMECEAVAEKQFALCDARHQPEEALYGIEKESLRSQFLANSKVTDQKVKKRCMESVDPESQRQLGMLQTIVAGQNENCTRTSVLPTVNSIIFAECQQIRLISLISELFTHKEIPEGRSLDSAEKCYARVHQLKNHCKNIRNCCPQNVKCVSNNSSPESRKFNEIVEQLKEEQTLCEKRRMRILNGLVKK